ncbi:hypothetical protein CDD83_4490 [Cordyceps sp. RAO-2017]|nr:hypothetical protein CDD83_4490 [Cordyceps sp. RAO-2017]
MRFTIALTSVLAGSATAAVATRDLANVDVDADVAVDVLTRDVADIDVDADIDAEILRRDLVDADVDADVDVEILGRSLVDADVAADVSAQVGGLLGLNANVGANVDVGAARRAGKNFKCPSTMSYCPWTKSCACQPGMKLDMGAKKCAGKKMTGAWPAPRTDVHHTKGVKLDKYCAVSPYKIVQYDAGHEYCQAGLNTITFVASADIAAEIAARAGLDIDVRAGVSADLKAVVAGLAGLYLGSSVDAVVLFNTNLFGHGAVQADVAAHISLGLLGNLRGLFCGLGLGKCNFDCVSYCTKGCKNYIDVGANVGANLEGLVGLAILPNVLLIVDGAKHIVTVTVDGLLCIVGGLLKNLLGLFNCNCY